MELPGATSYPRRTRRHEGESPISTPNWIHSQSLLDLEYLIIIGDEGRPGIIENCYSTVITAQDTSRLPIPGFVHLIGTLPPLT